MKLLAPLIYLSLFLASIAVAAPETHQPAAPQENTAPALWLTADFDHTIPFGINPHDAEVSTLVTPNVRFQQQFTSPKGTYGIAGVLGAITDGQYPLWIRFTRGSVTMWETRGSLSLDKEGLGVAVESGSVITGCYQVRLSHAPEWRDETGWFTRGHDVQVANYELDLNQDTPPAQATSPFHVTVTPLDRQVYSGYKFRVALCVTNTSRVPQSFVAFNCSWLDNWQAQPSEQSEQSHVLLDRECNCAANAPQTITLKPGESYEKKANMSAWTDKKGHKFYLHFQVGFTTSPKPMFAREVPGAGPIYWSDTAVMEVVK